VDPNDPYADQVDSDADLEGLLPPIDDEDPDHPAAPAAGVSLTVAVAAAAASPNNTPHTAPSMTVHSMHSQRCEMGMAQASLTLSSKLDLPSLRMPLPGAAREPAGAPPVPLRAAIANPCNRSLQSNRCNQIAANKTPAPP
jgi:hypothetical protein